MQALVTNHPVSGKSQQFNYNKNSKNKRLPRNEKMDIPKYTINIEDGGKPPPKPPPKRGKVKEGVERGRLSSDQVLEQKERGSVCLSFPIQLLTQVRQTINQSHLGSSLGCFKIVSATKPATKRGIL